MSKALKDLVAGDKVILEGENNLEETIERVTPTQIVLWCGRFNRATGRERGKVGYFRRHLRVPALGEADELRAAAAAKAEEFQARRREKAERRAPRLSGKLAKATMLVDYDEHPALAVALYSSLSDLERQEKGCLAAAERLEESAAALRRGVARDDEWAGEPAGSPDPRESMYLFRAAVAHGKQLLAVAAEALGLSLDGFAKIEPSEIEGVR